MKYSSIMHATGILISIAGGIALLGAWIARESGTFAGLSQQHLYWDALDLQLVGVAAGICAIYRRTLEKESPGSFF